ncbi:unnamed protein product [Toxocara canis]|uniref:Palmitoyltransferase n=1 Tax=Toxocara canis TaxID=6265 RepID=A0A183USH4_TOXCA|nr:unnamed protein product [Toxocara canis]
MSLRPTNSYPIDQKAKVCDKRDSIRTKFRPSDAPKDWCRLCTRVVYLPAEGMPTGSRDKTWCLPCDCRIRACTIIYSNDSNLYAMRKCSLPLQYGSWFDFLWRYPCRTTVPVLIYLATVIFAAWAIYKWRTSYNFFSMSQFSLLFAAAALLFLSTLLFSCWVLYIVGISREQFVRRYGQIIVFDHITSANRRIHDRLQQLRLGALLLNRTLSGVSSVYQQRIDQASIAGMTAFDHDHWLASSTPLLDCTKQQFEFAMQEKPKETDTNQNMCAVHQPARISSTLIVHEYSDDPSLRGESASPQWSKSTTVTDALNVDVTEP